MQYIRLYFVVLTLIILSVSCTSVDSLIEDKHIDKAIDFCQKAKEEKALCYEKIGDDYFKKGAFKEAEKFYGFEFANHSKKRKKASYQIAEDFLDKKQYQKALKYYDKTERRKEGYLKIAQEYLKQDMLFNARSIYRIFQDTKGMESIAKKYLDQGFYLKAFDMYKNLKEEKKHAYAIAKKLVKVKNYKKAAELFHMVSNVSQEKEAYKQFAYYLLHRESAKTLLQVKSPIVSILKSEDFIFAITQKGEVYQSYLYEENFKKVFALSNKKLRVYRASYVKDANQIILLSNGGLLFYDAFRKKIDRHLKKKIHAFAVSEKSDFLLTATDHVIAVRDFNTFEELLFFKGHTARVNTILVSGDQVYSAGKDKLVRAWNINDGVELFKLRGHFMEITDIALNAKANLLSSVSLDKKLKIWELKRKRSRNTFDLKHKLFSLTLSNDLSKVVVNMGKRAYELIDLTENKTKNGKLFHSHGIKSLALDAFDAFIYSGDVSGKLYRSNFEKDVLLDAALSQAVLSKEDYYNIAKIYFDEMKLEQALKYYTLSGHKDEGHIKVGDYYYNQEDYQQALNYYTLIDQPEYIKKVAEIYFKIGDYNQASQYYFKSDNDEGVKESAKMFLYEDNYYDATRMYLELIKVYLNKEEKEKAKAIYLTLSKMFLEMKETEYRGSEDPIFIKKVNEELKKWYERRFDLAQEYYNKAEESEKGYLTIGKYLCEQKKFDLGVASFQYMENREEADKETRTCQSTGAEHYYYEAIGAYKNLSQLVADSGDWDLIKENFQQVVTSIAKSKAFYQELKNYKQLKRIQKVERGLKRYKKRLGI